MAISNLYFHFIEIPEPAWNVEDYSSFPDVNQPNRVCYSLGSQKFQLLSVNQKYIILEGLVEFNEELIERYPKDNVQVQSSNKIIYWNGIFIFLKITLVKILPPS